MNGALNLGLCSGGIFKDKELVHNIVDGTIDQYGSATQFDCDLMETTPDLYTELKNRRNTVQNVYIITASLMIVMYDVRFSISRQKRFGSKAPYVIRFRCTTQVEANVEENLNLMS